ncbi:hypothetical protein OCU04_008348 [Sclerotinia nivalis]|uniref:beta-glucosidase n=1 Tax=Sclerotinia nivalis TaxID=352851 RepID=A0A9X0DHZ8_9HELO|nr:hypothetical protein OCU04_008348 [Sclerotinia nivalis]
MGLEFRVKGVNVALGPAIGGLGRVVLGGRNWESFSNDPYLAGQLAAESVKGIQEVGVIASSKHLIANEASGVTQAFEVSNADQRTSKKVIATKGKTVPDRRSKQYRPTLMTERYTSIISGHSMTQ